MAKGVCQAKIWFKTSLDLELQPSVVKVSDLHASSCMSYARRYVLCVFSPNLSNTSNITISRDLAGHEYRFTDFPDGGHLIEYGCGLIYGSHPHHKLTLYDPLY